MLLAPSDAYDDDDANNKRWVPRAILQIIILSLL